MYEAMQKYNEIPPYEEFGYRSKTTLWGDFGVADVYRNIEKGAIEDTFKRVWADVKDDQEYGTELSMVLNHKMWEWAEKDPSTSKQYQKLWEKVDKYIMDNWKGEKLKYYIRITD